MSLFRIHCTKSGLNPHPAVMWQCHCCVVLCCVAWHSFCSVYLPLSHSFIIYSFLFSLCLSLVSITLAGSHDSVDVVFCWFCCVVLHPTTVHWLSLVYYYYFKFIHFLIHFWKMYAFISNPVHQKQSWISVDVALVLCYVVLYSRALVSLSLFIALFNYLLLLSLFIYLESTARGHVSVPILRLPQCCTCVVLQDTYFA